MEKPLWICVTGPLASYAQGYRAELAVQGYSSWTTKAHLELMGHVSAWLSARELRACELDASRVGLFLADRKASGQVRRLTPRGMAPLMGYLRGLGVAPEIPVFVPANASEAMVVEFVRYLRDERGLAERTTRWYAWAARLFLAGRVNAPEDTQALRAGDVTGFVLAQCPQRSTGSLGNLMTALRALLQFFYIRGYTHGSLVGAVPATRAWHDGGQPRGLDPVDVVRMLKSCDRRTGAGCRDFAILTVLTRLGLRAAEVAALTVDDVDWRAGALAVSGKGGRHDLLPLPVDVGRAVADYCRRGRRRSGCKALFLQVRAPFTALSSSAVSYVVVRACERAGLPRAHAHRLRHTAAMAMRGAGAPLSLIGQVLRHEHETTTAGYARDSRQALATVARQWPGGVS